MNRKQKRDWLRSTRGKGNDVGPREASRQLRMYVFGGVFGRGLKHHFDSTGKGI